MTPKIVITGTAGFLGSHLLETVLAAIDFQVVAVDSLRHNGMSPNVRDVLALDPTYTDRVHVITHDLRAPFTRMDLKHLVDADYIIHAASLCQVEQSIDDPVGFIENNVLSTLTMLELARLSPKLERFILISTDEVYGPARAESFTHYQPSSPYAASKASQEVITNAYRITFKIPTTIVNISNMFGPRQSQLAFVPRAIRMLRNSEIISIHTNRMGHIGGRHYSYVRDVAHHLVRRMRDDLNGTYSLESRIQLPGHTYLSNKQLVRDLYGIMQITSPFNDVIERVNVENVRPGHDFSYAALGDDIDWLPNTFIEDALAETVEWFSLHPEWLDE